jgi:hypothetical protein
MTSVHDALAALGLAESPDADMAAIQQAFERMARRYPQASFPERFRRLLEARDHLLNPARGWREEFEARTLDLSWLLPHLASLDAGTRTTSREALQAMLRAGYLAEPLPYGLPPSWL